MNRIFAAWYSGLFKQRIVHGTEHYDYRKRHAEESDPQGSTHTAKKHFSNFVENAAVVVMT